MNIKYDIYCPICQRSITPSNIAEYEAGEHDGLIYVHDDIVHDEEEMDSLISYGVQ